MNWFSSAKKLSGSASILERSSSGWTVNSNGNGPARPPMPSKASENICQVWSTMTAMSSCRSIGFALTTAAGAGSDCSCSSRNPFGAAPTAQRRAAPFCDFADSLCSLRRSALSVSSPPPVSSTLTVPSAMLQKREEKKLFLGTCIHSGVFI